MKKKRNKRFLACLGIFFLVIAVIVTIGKSGLALARENSLEDYEDFTKLPLLRFHIRAESNDSIHQEEKMAVRKAVLGYIQEEIPEGKSKTEVKHIILEKRENLEQIILKTLEQYGVEPTVSIYFTKEFFPMRQYGQVIVPAGIYEAMRIDLGKAKGKNWWCVLYPSFCLIDPEHILIDPEDEKKLEALFSQDQPVDIEYKSYVLQWLKNLKK
ncbi:MAG: stage II sporulation protein R [Lachnospiraceae bacterium]|nr:stage II sporulation protein R [Lachnospiraceae bacterium]